MENTKNDNLLYRLLDIDLKKFLQGLGFSGLQIDTKLWAFNNRHYPTTIYVNDKHNTWSSVNDHTREKTIVELGQEVLKWSTNETFDQLKKHPDLPGSSNPDRFMLADRRIREPLNKPQAIYSELASYFFKSMKLPLSFASKYCNEFELKLGDEGRICNAFVLKEQSNLNHLIVTRPAYEDKESTIYMADEIFSDAEYQFINRGTQSVDVFSNITDLLVKQYEYDRLNIKAPSQILLSDVMIFERARKDMEKHQFINLYLPNLSVENLVKSYATWLSPRYRDFSNTYRQHTELSLAHISSAGTGQLKPKRPGKSI